MQFGSGHPALRSLDDVVGLPAHPLVIHTVVVAVPVAAGIAAACALSARFRRRFDRAAIGAAVVALAAGYAAYVSGHDLERRLVPTEATRSHVSIGSALNTPLIVLLVAVVGVAVVGRLRDRLRPTDGRPYRNALQVAAVVASALTLLTASTATTALYRIGRSGATASWERIAPAGSGVTDGRR